MYLHAMFQGGMCFLLLLLLSRIVMVAFLVAMTTHQTRVKKEFIWAHSLRVQSTVVGKTQQEREADGRCALWPSGDDALGSRPPFM